MPIEYRQSTGRWHDTESGQFVPKSRVVFERKKEIARLETRLAGLGRLVGTGKIPVSEFQTRMMETIKASHIRMAALGAGGKDNLNNAIYGAVGGRLSQESNKYLKNFGKRLVEDKDITLEYIIWRSKLYAKSANRTFHKARKIERIIAGSTLARRRLGGNKNHCLQCPYLTTNGKFVPVEDVTAIGDRCDCMGNCQCEIDYLNIATGKTYSFDKIGSIVERVVKSS